MGAPYIYDISRLRVNGGGGGRGERGGVTMVAAQNLIASRHLRYILAKHKTQEYLWYNEQSQFSVQFQYC